MIRPQWTVAAGGRRRGRAGRRVLALLGLVGLLLVDLLLAGVGPATAAPVPPAGGQTFGVQPASAGKPDRRPYFTYSVTPGAVLTDQLAVANISLRPLTLRVYARDAFNTPDGGFDVLAAKGKSTDVGSWLTVASGLVTVPARSKKIVPFRLRVPANATPGDHAGGIVASITSVGRDRNGNPVRLDQRVGARVYLRVSGPLHPNLAVTGMRTDYRGTANPAGCGDLGVTYQVHNEGNVRLAGHQRVRVSGPFGSGAKVQNVPDLPELLPGSVATVSTTVHCVRPTIRVNATATVNPVPPAGGVSAIAPSAIGRTGLWALPWIGVGMLLVLVVLGWLYLRQRRRDGSAAKPTPPEPPAGPPPAPAGSAGVPSDPVSSDPAPGDAAPVGSAVAEVAEAIPTEATPVGSAVAEAPPAGPGVAVPAGAREPAPADPGAADPGRAEPAVAEPARAAAGAAGVGEDG